MTTAIYRKRSNEVLKISLLDQRFNEADPTYFGVLTNPILPDGIETLNENGDLRVLGHAKIADVGTNTIRNATQGEIDTFASAEAIDDAAMDTERALIIASLDPIFRKVFKALLNRIVDELFHKTNAKVNDMVQQWEAFKATVIAATSLADIQAAAQNAPAIAPDLVETLTLEQAIQVLLTDIQQME